MIVLEVLLLLLLRSTGLMAEINCSRYVPGDLPVRATCDWTGLVSVSWSTTAGIMLYYNCTGATTKSAHFYGWAYQTTAMFPIDTWNYRNSTCYIYGCYADELYDTYSIPSVACTVLTPPLPTSTPVLHSPAVTLASALSYTYTSEDVVSLSDEFRSSFFVEDVMSLSDEFRSSFFVEDSEPPTSTSRTQQTPLLIMAATVSIAVVASLSFILLIIGGMSLRRRNKNNLHKLQIPYMDDEEKIEPNIYPDNISITSSNESDFDPFVPIAVNDEVKDDIAAESGIKELLEADTVSECKTVPLEEETMDREMGNKDDSENTNIEQGRGNHETGKQNQSSFSSPTHPKFSSPTCPRFSSPTHLEFSSPTHLEFSSPTHPRFSNPTHLPYLRIHPIKTPEDSSTSTYGTSDYICTTDTSGAYTVSTNHMDYALFPDDFSPLPENITEGEECNSDMATPRRYGFSWGNPPPPGGASVARPQPDVGGDLTLDFVQSQPNSAWQEDESSDSLRHKRNDTGQCDTEIKGERHGDACCGDGVSRTSGRGYQMEEEDDSRDIEDVGLCASDEDESFVKRSNASIEES